MQKLSPRKLQELQALLDQGLRMLQGGDPQGACFSYETAARIAPRHFDVLHMHGIALGALGEHTRAEAQIGLAVRLKPESGRAQLNYGVALRSLGRFEDAVPHLREAVRRLPTEPIGWFNLANGLRDTGEADEALRHYRKALELQPGYHDALNNLCKLLSETQDFPAAAECVASLIAMGSPLPWLPGHLHHLHARYCNCADHDKSTAQLLAMVEARQTVAAPFALFSLPTTASQLLAAAQTYISHECPVPPVALWQGERYTHSRIRLAYLSADMHEHATAYLMAELFELHDRSRFEIFVFAYDSPADNPMRARLEAGVDHFIDITALDDHAAAQRIREHEIDIAVDLKGFTRSARPAILAHRPAPLQVNYLGYPGSMGASFIDYIVADPVLIPHGAEAGFSEKILRLPDSYQPNDRRRPISITNDSRAEHGLPEQGFVFCCFNNNFKITPDVFDIWMRLLAQIEGSVLWLYEDNPYVASQLHEEAEKRDIEASRLIFAERLPLAKHLARHRHADLFIDTFWCNAHTTASDALWAGLPVVTRAGETFVARVAASLLSACDMRELITTDAREYEALCLALARDEERLGELRRKLERTRSEVTLLDTPRYTRQLESGWVAIHARHHAGLPPEHTHIPS